MIQAWPLANMLFIKCITSSILLFFSLKTYLIRKSNSLKYEVKLYEYVSFNDTYKDISITCGFIKIFFVKIIFSLFHRKSIGCSSVRGRDQPGEGASVWGAAGLLWSLWAWGLWTCLWVHSLQASGIKPDVFNSVLFHDNQIRRVLLSHELQWKYVINFRRKSICVLICTYITNDID